MKIIFLDIDGVLIKLQNVRKRKQRTSEDRNFERFFAFKNKFVQNLSEIAKETGASIVISSSWRRSPMLMEKIKLQFQAFYDRDPENNVDLWNRVISKTRAELGGGRGHEILDYIDRYHRTCKNGYHITNWVSIDDDRCDMKPIIRLGKLVNTESHLGLDSEKTQEAITILNS